MGKITKYSAVNLLSDLKIDPARWSSIPSDQEIARTVEAVKARGIEVVLVQDGSRALEKIVEFIPSGSEVMNGSSTTLIEIGYDDPLIAERGWMDLHAAVVSEDDAEKRNEIRRKSVTAEYFLSGVNAIAMTGELVSCDATGSRVGAWPFAARRLLLVAGVNKIVPTLQDALQRIRDYAFPLEDARFHRIYGLPSRIGKCVILAGEAQAGRTTLILARESLGY